ncbi:MAG TPA: hypothetical protein VGY97_02755 [Solirubrobacteraceae bacterium]|jgi:hypothetical protein|nr:hypothetical protein [Solirubrobacteraceae bacterium]
MKEGQQTVTTGQISGTPPASGPESFCRLVAQLTAKCPEGRRDASTAAADGLHVCVECASILVYPIGGTPVELGQWALVLRCPDCGLVRQETWDDGLIEDFDLELDRGEAQLVSDLHQLSAANMVDYIDRFVCALEADGIYPIDF